MCRLLGIVVSEPSGFHITLREAPRSLATLSREHKDGWGIAVRDGMHERSWRVHHGIECAQVDERFHQLAQEEQGEILVAHVRRRTVGPLAIENTHPFRAGRWVFAHNGTIDDTSWIDAAIAPERRRGVGGTTDSERFFAWLLTRMDAAGVTDAPAGPELDAVIAAAAAEARARTADEARRKQGSGAITFLLSDGASIWAHRHGRTLYALERRPGDPVRTQRESSEGVAIATRWSEHRHAILLASEALTDEPWREIPEGGLVRVDRTPEVAMQVLG